MKKCDVPAKRYNDRFRSYHGSHNAVAKRNAQTRVAGPVANQRYLLKQLFDDLFDRCWNTGLNFALEDCILTMFKPVKSGISTVQSNIHPLRQYQYSKIFAEQMAVVVEHAKGL
jgi:hypothetical protein